MIFIVLHFPVFVLYISLPSLPASFFSKDDFTGAQLTTSSTTPPSSSHLAASSTSLRPCRRSPRSRHLSWSVGLASDRPQLQSSNPSWSKAWAARCPESGPPWAGSSPLCAGCLNTSSASTSGAMRCPAWSLASSWCRNPSPTACWQEWRPSMDYTPPFTPTSSTSSWARPDTSLWGSSASWASWLDRYCSGSPVASNAHTIWVVYEMLIEIVFILKMEIKKDIQ